MINFFLINETLELDDNVTFKNGILKLNSIEKKADHIFRKNDSIYNLNCYESLFSDYGQEEQVVVKFLEQLSTMKEIINTEDLANSYSGTDVNGFLGVDFSKCTINEEVKKVGCNITYSQWIDNYASNFDKLNTLVDNFNFSNNFEKDFKSSSLEIQESIINQFIKSIKRGLKTPFYPDTKIVKDVSPDNHKCKVMELRVYSPVALRVYFNESNSFVNVISIEQKSNPNQSVDINKAHDDLLKV